MASTNIQTFPGKVGVSNTNPIHTLDIGSNVYIEDTADTKFRVYGNIHASGITVDGSITVIETDNLSVKDPVLLLAAGSTGTSDTGIIMKRSDGDSNVAIFYDEGVGLKLGHTLSSGDDIHLSVDTANALATSVYGPVNVVNSGTQALSVDGGAQVDGNFQVGVVSNLFVNTATSNVGIGTTTPAYKLEVDGKVGIQDELKVTYDADTASYFGRAAVGYMGQSDQASFSHLDKNTSTNFALKQAASGATHINTPTGQHIRFSVNASEVGRFSGGGDFKVGNNPVKFYVDTALSEVQMYSQATGSTAGPDLVLMRDNPNNGGNNEYIGQIRYEGRNDTGGSLLYAKTTGKIKTASNGSEDGVIETMIKTGGSNRISVRHSGAKFLIQNGTDLQVGEVANLYVDTSTSAVGIGTATPRGVQHIWKDGSNGDHGLLIEQNNAGTGSATLKFGVAHTSESTAGLSKAGIFFKRAAANGRGDLLFCVDNANDTSDVDTSNHAMTIYRDGKVGIGTASPSYKLNILTDTNYDGISLRDSTRELLKISKGNNGAYINMFESGASKVNISTNGDSYINGGNVGMGIAIPAAKLDVRGAVADPSTPTVHIGDNAADAGDYGMVNLVRDATNGGSKSHLAFIRNGNTVVGMGFHNNTNTWGIFPSFSGVTNTPAMAIDASGNVGIGTASPGEKLDVRGAIVAPVVSYAGNQNAAYLIPAATSYTGAATNWGTYGFQHRIKTDSGGNPRITIDDGNANEVFTIKNGGNIGIGTTNPNTKLHIYEPSSVPVLQMEAAASGQAVYSMYRNNNLASPVYVGMDGNGLTNLSAGSLMLATGSTDVVFAPNYGGRGISMRIDNNGNVGIGVVAQSKLHVNGRVMSNQPRFFAWSNNGSTSFNGGATCVLNSTAYNSGSHYSTTTGYFTAPVNGVYQFSLGVYTYTSMQYSWKLVPTAGSLSSNNMHVSRNNGTGDDLLIASTFNSGQFSAAITLYLNANEQFGWGSRSSSGSYYGAHSHFSGYLLSQV